MTIRINYGTSANKHTANLNNEKRSALTWPFYVVPSPIHTQLNAHAHTHSQTHTYTHKQKQVSHNGNIRFRTLFTVDRSTFIQMLIKPRNSANNISLNVLTDLYIPFYTYRNTANHVQTIPRHYCNSLMEIVKYALFVYVTWAYSKSLLSQLNKSN